MFKSFLNLEVYRYKQHSIFLMKYYVESQNINEKCRADVAEARLAAGLSSVQRLWCLPACSPTMPKVNLNIHDLTVLLILVVNVNISVIGMHRLN